MRNCVLLALPATAIAVSLADFKPRVSDLPSNCQTVYSGTIEGCSPTDFTSPTCSDGCVKALQALTADVKSACGSESTSGTNIIAAFLNNAGPQGLCTNADAVLGSGKTQTSAATSTTPATSARPSSSSLARTASRVESSTSSEVSTSATTSSTDTATSLTSATFAPSSTGAIAVDASSRTATATATASSQASTNGDSGGGSPFDAEGNMYSRGSTLELTMATVLLAASVALASALR